MARPTVHGNTLTLRLDSELKSVLEEAANESSRPVGEVVRGLIRDFAREKRRREFLAEARRQSRILAEEAKGEEEAESMRWIDDVADRSGWK
ncbi:MAG: DUF3018 family protein [Proteobacteria bacterium]|nr:DUF3018 family protein [Pseudomonadota bacterium]